MFNIRLHRCARRTSMELIYLAEHTVFEEGLEPVSVAGRLSVSRFQSMTYCVCSCSLMATMIAKMPSIGRGCPILMLNLVARWRDAKRCERDVRRFHEFCSSNKSSVAITLTSRARQPNCKACSVNSSIEHKLARHRMPVRLIMPVLSFSPSWVPC